MKLSYNIAIQLFDLDYNEINNSTLIKKRYKQLMLKYHPDKTNGNHKNAQIINEAYLLLLSEQDPIKILENIIYTEFDNQLKLYSKNLELFLNK